MVSATDSAQKQKISHKVGKKRMMERQVLFMNNQLQKGINIFGYCRIRHFPTVGYHRIRRFQTVGHHRILLSESDDIRLSENVGNQRISPVSDYRYPVGSDCRIMSDFLGSDGMVSTWG
jgi:hypothetical protein